MLVRLTRVVRFTVCDPPPIGRQAAAPLGEPRHAPTGSNGHGGKPAMRGLGRYYELAITCTGTADPQTGYLVNIKSIDAAAHDRAIPRIARACQQEPWRDPATLMAELLELAQLSLNDQLNQHPPAAPLRVLVDQLTWHLTPTFSVTMERSNMTSVLLRQRFDFAAAHRLHVPTLTDEQNRAIFGRCNNPAGHGHNYTVQPTVRVQLNNDATAAPTFDLPALERITDETIIQPFDHTHLNEDTAAFAPGTGLNPSVEHIARIFYERLKPAIAAASAGQAELVDITVWETERTSACYAGT